MFLKSYKNQSDPIIWAMITDFMFRLILSNYYYCWGDDLKKYICDLYQSISISLLDKNEFLDRQKKLFLFLFNIQSYVPCTLELLFICGFINDKLKKLLLEIFYIYLL